MSARSGSDSRRSSQTSQTPAVVGPTAPCPSAGPGGRVRGTSLTSACGAMSGSFYDSQLGSSRRSSALSGNVEPQVRFLLWIQSFLVQEWVPDVPFLWIVLLIWTNIFSKTLVLSMVSKKKKKKTEFVHGWLLQCRYSVVLVYSKEASHKR